MTYDHRNLAETVHARTVAHRSPCAVGRVKTDPLYARLAAEDHDPSHLIDNAHQWRGGTVCLNCGKTLAQVMVRPSKRQSTIGRAIANMRADVPPVQFIRRSV